MHVADEPEVEQSQVQQSRAAIEALEPAVPERRLVFNWVLPDGRATEKVYTQAALGMFPTQEFITKITEIIDSFVQGESGMKLGELFSGEIELPETYDTASVNKVIEDNIQLVNAFIKLVRVLPDFQLDIMCLSLGIPRMEREWARTQLQEPPHRGGLTVDDGFDVLIMFIKQNTPLLRDTFLGKARELAEAFNLNVVDQEKEPPTSSSSSSTSSPEEEATASPSSTPGGTPSTTSLPDTQGSV